MKSDLDKVKHLAEGKDPLLALKALAQLFPGKVTFSSSLGYEDQVITHMLFSGNIPVPVFTLDTGRLFNETYAVWNSTLTRYNKPIQVYYPDTAAVEKLVKEKGPLSFYESAENRKECCYIRKVEPLKRALKGMDIWITGIRADQSGNRQGLAQVEWDESNSIIKYHPLLHWDLEQVKDFIREHNIPYNSLHDKGFVSIGCAPCTRAIRKGEDFRAGRWWWENNKKKECGLHES